MSRHQRPSASAGLIARAAMFGAAIGGRGSLLFAGPVLARALAGRGLGGRGLAGRAVAGRAGRGASGPGVAATIAAAAGLGGELVADKLPATPSRLDPPAFAGRVAAALTGAVVLARRERSGALLPILAAALAAVLAAVVEVRLGVRWRGFTRKRGRALAGALVEDAVVLGLAAIACWPRNGERDPRS